MKSIKHITGERNTVGMRALIQEVGIKGFGVYWYFVEELHEKTVLELNDGFYDLYAVVFQLKPEEVKKIVSAMLKFKVMLLNGETLTTEQRFNISKKRSEAGIKSTTERWKDHVKEEKPKVEEPKGDKLEQMIKDIVAKTPPKEQKEDPILVEKKKPTRRKATPKQDPSEIKVSPEDFDALEAMEVKQPPLKEWEFLPMFNEIKLQYKPNAKGNQTLSPTDKTNLKRLITSGYSKEDFTKAIHGQMCSKWVIDNDMQVPTHILRNENFVRYLEKSTYKIEKPFTANLTDEPVYK